MTMLTLLLSAHKSTNVRVVDVKRIFQRSLLPGLSLALVAGCASSGPIPPPEPYLAIREDPPASLKHPVPFHLVMPQSR